MTRKTKFSFALLGLAALVVGFALGIAPAHAQSASCAPSDLACRVAALEARLAALEGRQGALETRQQTTAAQAEALQRAMPTEIGVTRRCATNCQAEAQEMCVARGFAHGTADEWSRDRGAGGVTLSRIACTH